eukprot:CAMPEP_0118825560 /NCGR_PEP_ID=MMETSP1162-20130426/11387_1 /TAXON_ID=33656 /ORGANISM="Phaeocystis Sp, Strain CCMP2710" /LENGTH=343 /DNA_ID=CAMNT_0006756243 /DNA_START=1 /DNA_END=1032 /DNA_ORIENTATION=+
MALALLTLFLPPLAASGLDNQQVSNDTSTNTSKEWCEKWLTDLREPGTRVKRVRRLWDHAREAINLPPLSWTESESRFAEVFATFTPGASIMRNNRTAVWFTNVWKSGSETVRVGLYFACQSGLFDCQTFTAHLTPTKDSASGMLWSGSREVVRFSVVRDPLSHFLSGLAETRFRSDRFCASQTATQCTALASVGNSSQRPLLTLNAILAAQLPAHFFRWAAPHMWLQSGSLINEQDAPSEILHLETFDSEWEEFRSELLSSHNFKLFPTAPELKWFGTSNGLASHVASQDPTRERQLMTEFLQQRPGYRAALCRLLEPDYHCFRRYATVDLCAQEVRRGWHS